MTRKNDTSRLSSRRLSPVTPDDDPTNPFGGAGAARPPVYTVTDARPAANNNALPPACNDNTPPLGVREEMKARLGPDSARAILATFAGKPLLRDTPKPRSSEPVNCWLEPWLGLLKLANILLCHAAGLLLIDAFARFLESGFGMISTHPLEWTFWGVKVTLYDITGYTDFFIVVVFFGVAFRDVIKWAKQK